MFADDWQANGWEISGKTAHASMAAANAVARWLSSMEHTAAGWEYASATLEDGSHRVLRRRLGREHGRGAEPTGGADRPNGRPRTAPRASPRSAAHPARAHPRE